LSIINVVGCALWEAGKINVIHYHSIVEQIEAGKLPERPVLSRFIRDSIVKFDNPSGRRPPSIVLSETSSVFNCEQLPSETGSVPLSKLLFNHNSVKLTIQPIFVGMVPVKLFCCKFKYANFVRYPICIGMVP